MTESTPADRSAVLEPPSPRRLAGRRLAVLLATDAGERRWREIRPAAERRHRIAGVWRLDRGEGDGLGERIGTEVDLVVCEPAVGEDRGQGRRLLAAAAEAGVPALDLIGFFTALTGRLPLDLVAPAWLARRLLERSHQRRFKRLFDLVAGSLLFVLSLPVQLLIAVAILIDSGRPVLRREERLRRFKEPFTRYRFRTLAAAAGEPRVTRAGRLLRRFRLDALPQLWNVVCGHLSLVGPRPVGDVVSRRLAERQPVSNLRFLHRPGLTGWSQVRGLRGSTDDELMLELETDLLYLAGGRFVDDLYILWRTLWMAVGGKGALAAGLLVFAGIAGPALGAPAEPLIANPDGRRTVSLDGEWRTIVDPYENGYYDYRYRPSANGYFKNAKPEGPSDLVEYDFDRSPTLAVPGDWSSQRESLLFYEGTVWYKRSFDAPPGADSRLFVYFGAANYRARVYLNGEKLGEHEGGFTPFNFEITGRVRAKDNFLVVQVDNQRRREGVPTLNTDWWNYGGLTRRVLLVAVPETFVRGYHVQLAPGSLDRLSGWIRLDGARRGGQTVRLEIPEAGVGHAVVTDEEGLAILELDARLSLWSPDRPKRYRVAIAAPTDRVEEQIGFRAVATRGSEILLNGEPIFLRGVSLHEEAPLRPGRAHSREDARTLLGWARELGANFVRLAHYPHNAFMVDEAERMGLLLWAEIPVYWTIQWSDPRTFENAAGQLAEMIDRDRNRAAVILWSIGNETPLSAERLDFMRRLTERARQLDPTRLLTAAMERRYLDGSTLMIDDPLGEHLDVLGCNEYVGWYDGLPAKADRLVWKTVYDKPLVMSELGGGALWGRHGDAGERWTEEYQEDLYRHQIAMLRKISFLRGMSPWILVDFRSPRRHLPEIQDFWNRKGLVSETGRKKKAFYILQSFYRSLPAAGPAPPGAVVPSAGGRSQAEDRR